MQMKMRNSLSSCFRILDGPIEPGTAEDLLFKKAVIEKPRTLKRNPHRSISSNSIKDLIWSFGTTSESPGRIGDILSRPENSPFRQRSPALPTERKKGNLGLVIERPSEDP